MGGKRVEHQHHTHLHKKKGERERGNRRGFSTLSSLWTIDSNQPPPPPPPKCAICNPQASLSPFRDTGRKGKGKRHRRRHFQQLAFSFLFELPSHIPIKKFFFERSTPTRRCKKNPCSVRNISFLFIRRDCVSVSQMAYEGGRPSEDWRSERDVGFAKGTKVKFFIFPFYVL